jgi:hypothetical protein
VLNKTLKPLLILASLTLFISTAQAGPALGDTYEGGIVFYVSANGQHGLIVSPADLRQEYTWDNGAIVTTGATRDGVYGGRGDTDMIITKQIGNNPNGKFAALAAADYQGAGYGDWYLPSKAELLILMNYAEATYNDTEGDLGFTFVWNGLYWSSTEDHSTGGAWEVLYASQENGTGDASAISFSKSNTFHVRPIRAF